MYFGDSLWFVKFYVYVRFVLCSIMIASLGDEGAGHCVGRLLVIEPSHGIMVLVVPRKLIFQTRMRSHTVRLDV